MKAETMRVKRPRTMRLEMAMGGALIAALMAMPRSGGAVSPRGDSYGVFAVPIPSYEADKNGESLEARAYEWMGEMASEGRLDRITQPGSRFEFFGQLADHARATLKRGRMVRQIFIVTHGQGSDPAMGLMNAALVPKDLEFDRIRKEYLDAQQEFWKQRQRYFDLTTLPGPLNAQTMAAIDDVRNRLRPLEKKMAEQESYLQDIDTLSSAMAADANLYLMVCFMARHDANAAFSKALGELILGRRGGVVTASRTGVLVEKLPTSYLTRLLGYDTTYKVVSEPGYMDWLRHGDAYIDPAERRWLGDNWVRIPVAPGRRNLAPLRVSFPPAGQEAAPGQTVAIEAAVEAMPDSGKIRYQWQNGERTPAIRYELPRTEFRTLTVDVEATDEQGRRGKGRAFIVRERSGKVAVLHATRYAPGGGKPAPADRATTGKTQSISVDTGRHVFSLNDLKIYRPYAYAPRAAAEREGGPVLPPDAGPAAAARTEQAWAELVIRPGPIPFGPDGKVQLEYVPAPEQLLGAQGRLRSLALEGTLTSTGGTLRIWYPAETRADGYTVPAGDVTFDFGSQAPAAVAPPPVDMDATILYPPGM